VKQFILNAKPDRDNIVRLTGDDYRYLVRVRRLAAGEFFPAILPDGEKTSIQILSIDNETLTGCSKSVDAASSKTISSGDVQSEKLPPIILFQALTKGDKMDLIVRQAAEGGITEIVPFASDFSVAKTDLSGQKFPRWERIVREARQQSGSGIATTVRHPLKKDEIYEYWKEIKEKEDGATGFLFHHQDLEQNSLHSYLNNVPKIVTFAIGPEGGFSDTEASLFLYIVFNPIKIGDTILRSETAAVYCAATIKILLLERTSWELKQVKESNA
jgi:16S rRNA (uracil1498-N3)-methyltransferase